MANSKPIGVAYSDQNIVGADTLSATSIFATEQLGYTNGAYGTVTQLTNKATGVTINKTAGTITTANAQMAPGALVAFIVTNNKVSSLDTVIVNIASGKIHSLNEIIALFEKESNHTILIKRNPLFIRNEETFRLTGDIRKLSSIIDLPINHTISDVIKSFLL